MDDSILDEDVVKEDGDKKAEVEAEAEDEGGDANEILEEDDLIMEGSDPVIVEIKDSVSNCPLVIIFHICYHTPNDFSSSSVDVHVLKVDGDEIVDLCDDKEEKEEKEGKEEDAKDDSKYNHLENIIFPLKISIPPPPSSLPLCMHSVHFMVGI